MPPHTKGKLDLIFEDILNSEEHLNPMFLSKESYRQLGELLGNFH